MSFPILINKFFPGTVSTYIVLISIFILEFLIFNIIGRDFDTRLASEYRKISQFKSKMSQSPWIKYLVYRNSKSRIAWIFMKLGVFDS